MKRVSAELETVAGMVEEEELIVQGVRFAFRVHQVTKLPFLPNLQQMGVLSCSILSKYVAVFFHHRQFAGGFDVETMKAFQELRDKARSCHNERQHQRLASQSVSCEGVLQQTQLQRNCLHISVPFCCNCRVYLLIFWKGQVCVEIKFIYIHFFPIIFHHLRIKLQGRGKVLDC